jgi:integrase
MMIRRIFTWYIRELRAECGMEMNNPCEYLVLPKARKTRDKVISRAELKLLLENMTPEMAVVVELAFETAMRRSEILKLTSDDLFLEDRFLRVVDGKEGSRDVPLTRRAVSLLESTHARQAGRGGKLYPMAAYSVTQAVRRAREVLGMSDDVRFHQLRHSRISEVARMGLNQAQIMIVSGHRDIRSVQRYTHLNVRDVIGLID